MTMPLLLLSVLLLAPPALGQPTGLPPAKRVLFGIQTTPQDFTYDQLVTVWKDADAPRCHEDCILLPKMMALFSGRRR